MQFNKVSQFVEWLAQLEETDSEFSFANKRDLILKNMKNDWGYWEESQKTKQMKLYENVFSSLEEYQ
jgi:glycosylphosphatidylinositol transamidase (GPIT) subunit GPI8